MPVIAELVPAEVIDEVAIPVVKPPRLMPEQPKLRRVSSCGPSSGPRPSSGRQSSVSHGMRPRSVTGPPVRRDDQLLSDGADESGASGELLGEV